jgi:hypothetical protein
MSGPFCVEAIGLHRKLQVKQVLVFKSFPDVASIQQELMDRFRTSRPPEIFDASGRQLLTGPVDASCEPIKYSFRNGTHVQFGITGSPIVYHCPDSLKIRDIPAFLAQYHYHCPERCVRVQEMRSLVFRVQLDPNLAPFMFSYSDSRRVKPVVFEVYLDVNRMTWDDAKVALSTILPTEPNQAIKILDSRGKIPDGSDRLSATRASGTETFEVKLVPMISFLFGSKSMRFEFQGCRQISDLERFFHSGDGPGDRTKPQFSFAGQVLRSDDPIPRDSSPANPLRVDLVPTSSRLGNAGHRSSAADVPPPAQVPLRVPTAGRLSRGWSLSARFGGQTISLPLDLPSGLSDGEVLNIVSDRFDFGRKQFQLSFRGRNLTPTSTCFQSGDPGPVELFTDGPIRYRLKFFSPVSCKFEVILFNVTATVAEVRKYFTDSNGARAVCEFTQDGGRIFQTNEERLCEASFKWLPIEYVLRSMESPKQPGRPKRGSSVPDNRSPRVEQPSIPPPPPPLAPASRPRPPTIEIISVAPVHQSPPPTAPQREPSQPTAWQGEPSPPAAARQQRRSPSVQPTGPKRSGIRLGVKLLSWSAAPLMRLLQETSTIEDVLVDAGRVLGRQMDASKSYGVFIESSITPLDRKSLVSDLQGKSEVLVAPCADVTLMLPDGSERLVRMRRDVRMCEAGGYARTQFPNLNLVAASGRIIAPNDKLEELGQDGKIALRLTERVHDIQVTAPHQEPRNYRFAAEVPIAVLAGIFAADMGITKAFEVQDATRQLRKGALVGESSGNLRLLVQDERPPAVGGTGSQSGRRVIAQQSIEPDPEKRSPPKRSSGGGCSQASRGESGMLSRSIPPRWSPGPD